MRDQYHQPDSAPRQPGPRGKRSSLPRAPASQAIAPHGDQAEGVGQNPVRRVEPRDSRNEQQRGQKGLRDHHRFQPAPARSVRRRASEAGCLRAWRSGVAMIIMTILSTAADEALGHVVPGVRRRACSVKADDGRLKRVRGRPARQRSRSARSVHVFRVGDQQVWERFRDRARPRPPRPRPGGKAATNGLVNIQP